MRRLLAASEKPVLRIALLALAVLGAGCEERLLVGELRCPGGEGGAPSEDGGELSAPWSTGFEDGFCGYRRGNGFCYSDEISTYRLVTSPVRSGPFAAAFELGAGGAEETSQARCVRQGALPEAAYYSAWYYLPADVPDAWNWNLFHFQGGVDGELLDGTWDVSIRRNADDEPALILWDLRGLEVHAQEEVTVPFNRWFHVELFLRRAADETGEIALFQDGEELVRLTDVVTDSHPFTQWYVGNLVSSDTTSSGLLFVDDVEIRLPP